MNLEGSPLDLNYGQECSDMVAEINLKTSTIPNKEITVTINLEQAWKVTVLTEDLSYEAQSNEPLQPKLEQSQSTRHHQTGDDQESPGRADTALKSLVSAPSQELQEVQLNEIREHKEEASGDASLMKHSSECESKTCSPSAKLDSSWYSQRRDVLFKNIFRSVKKYYTNLFKSTTDFFIALKTKPQRRKGSLPYVQQFVSKHFIKEDFEELFGSVSVDEFCNYMGRIIIPEYFSTTKISYGCKKQCELLYTCIYKFSNAKAKRLFRSQVIRSIFLNFFEGPAFQEMLISDMTLSLSREHHEECVKELISHLKSEC